MFLEAAQIAWAFIDRNYQPATGLVRATDHYKFVTVWDISSMLAAYYSAKELGLIGVADYDARMRRALSTLATTGIYANVAYNRIYNAETGVMAGRDQKPDPKGHGWSASDMGRFAVWMKILATVEPQYAADIQRIIRRINFPAMIANGYLQGQDISPRTGEVRRFREGSLGYEQYAAEGFALWGHKAPKALSLTRNSKPVTVMGQPIFGDARGSDVTSEGFLLMGLELGWTSPAWREYAWRLLAAQEARYRRTRIVTIVNEDPVPVPPYYFYYYGVTRGDGQEFPVYAIGGGTLSNPPRWVSAKGAYSWHALLPSAYTALAVQTVAPAGVKGIGWGAGVYEGRGENTRGANVNTSGIILEAALYHARGRPLIVPR